MVHVIMGEIAASDGVAGHRADEPFDHSFRRVTQKKRGHAISAIGANRRFFRVVYVEGVLGSDQADGRLRTNVRCTSNSSRPVRANIGHSRMESRTDLSTLDGVGWTRTLARGSEASGGRLRLGVGLRRDFRPQRLGPHIRRGFCCDRIEGPVRDQLHAIGHEEPDQRVAPYQDRPAPPSGVTRNPKTQIRVATICVPTTEQQNSRRPYGPEWSTRARLENRQMSGHRQDEIHQGLDMGAVEMEDAVANIKQSKRRERPTRPSTVDIPRTVRMSQTSALFR